MRVTLCDFDGLMPNLALMRLSTFHKQRGDTVELWRGMLTPRLFGNPDRICVSCIFRWNRQRALNMQYHWDRELLYGGTGIDPLICLPAEVEECMPDYVLYPNHGYAIGFISRGCIRKCPWCVVPQKEGNIRREATAQEIVGEYRKAVFLDNNFLALPDREKDLEWLASNQITVDFNQGLDARLVDRDVAILLARCKWEPAIRLALDSLGMIIPTTRAIEQLLLSDIPASKIRVYVLIGFAGIESDIERLLVIHNLGIAPFPMGFRDLETGEEPARGWDRTLYRKYRRLITRVPMASSVWDSFAREVVSHATL